MVECGLAGKLDDGRAHHEALLPGRAGLLRRAEPAVFKGVLHAPGSAPDARTCASRSSTPAARAVERALATIADRFLNSRASTSRASIRARRLARAARSGACEGGVDESRPAHGRAISALPLAGLALAFAAMWLSSARPRSSRCSLPCT